MSSVFQFQLFQLDFEGVSFFPIINITIWLLISYILYKRRFDTNHTLKKLTETETTETIHAVNLLGEDHYSSTKPSSAQSNSLVTPVAYFSTQKRLMGRKLGW